MNPVGRECVDAAKGRRGESSTGQCIHEMARIDRSIYGILGMPSIFREAWHG